MEGGHSLYELGHKPQDLPGRMNSEIPENSKLSTPLLFLKEAPAEGHHLEELANNGITAAIPSSKYPLNPVDNVLALTSIDELDEGLHKKLPPGTRLLVSVPPDEPRERLLKLKEYDNVDFIFLEEPSIQTDTVPSQSSELEAYLKGNGIDLKVISWSNLPRINFRGSTTNARELQHELVEYIDLSAYMALNKHLKQYTDYTRHLIDDPDFSKSISTNINDSGIGPIGRVYEF